MRPLGLSTATLASRISNPGNEGTTKPDGQTNGGARRPRGWTRVGLRGRADRRHHGLGNRAGHEMRVAARPAPQLGRGAGLDRARCGACGQGKALPLRLDGWPPKL